MGYAPCQRHSGTQTYGEATIEIITSHLSRGKSLLEGIVPKRMLTQDVAHISAAQNLIATVGRRVLPNFRGSGIVVLLCVQRLRAPNNQWDISIAVTQTYLMGCYEVQMKELMGNISHSALPQSKCMVKSICCCYWLPSWFVSAHPVSSWKWRVRILGILRLEKRV